VRFDPDESLAVQLLDIWKRSMKGSSVEK